MKRNLRYPPSLVAMLGLLPLACTPTNQVPETKTETPEKVETLPDGLKYVDLKEGKGEPAKLGDFVEVFYTGWLKNGTQFETNVGKKPVEFQIGDGKVIKGWEEGIQGMKAGGRRKLIIPPQLAYGAEGSDHTIPPNEELTFVVELVKIKKEP